MPHSLRVRLKNLQRKGELTDRDIDRIFKLLDQEPCEDEYIKVPKKALKYRTAGMVAYNAEWLKNHFDMERAVICGEQQPCEDAISRQAVDILVDELARAISDERSCMSRGRSTATIMQNILDLPSVKPQEKTGHWEMCEDADGIYGVCDICGTDADFTHYGKAYPYCPNCGAKMIEPQERSE